MEAKFPIEQKKRHLCVSQAALPGFEPGDAGIRIRCLTVWRSRYNITWARGFEPPTFWSVAKRSIQLS